MKIGISVNSIYTIKKEKKNIDGIGIYTTNLCQALSNQNIQVKEIYFQDINEILKRKPVQEKDFYITNNCIFSLLPGNFYTNIQSKVDLVHVTNYLAPRIKGVPIISSIHDSIMLAHPEWLSCSRSINRLKSFLLKKLTLHTDHIITGSQSIIKDLVRLWKIPENKISVIYHGISPIWFQKFDSVAQADILKKYRLHKPFFLTVGTLQPRKNLERIINAYISLPKKIRENFNLVFAGKHHSSLTPRPLLEKILQFEKSGGLLWLNYPPMDDLRCLYQNAYALLYPSLAEGFGLPILEGFASATPVITSNTGATAEIAGEAAYLVDPYSEADIARGILELVENSSLRTELIQRGLSRARQFTWEKCAEKTIEVYKKYL